MQKHIYTLLMLLSFSFAVKSQTISYAMDSTSVTAALNDESTSPGDIEAHIQLDNSGATSTFKWVKEIVSAPEGWKFAVCDLNQCYLPSVEEKEFTFDAGSNFEMILHAYPGGNPGVTEDVNIGSAEVRVRVYEVGNEDNTVTATYLYSLDATTGILDIERKALQVYPNPTTDAFRISDNEYVKQVTISNLIGQKLLSKTVNNGELINVANLETGLYLVQMLGEDNKILKTVRLMKK